MATELLEIEPRELNFVFELKKQSSCLVQLGNKSDQYVAFKVKTTSPKKYCVRPNIGIIKPKEKCDFTVTMQAQRIAPPDMQCKDKFLIQSTVVPFGTKEDDITSDMFAKDRGTYIEEKKLRVVLLSPPSSPVLLPVNGVMKQDPCDEIYVQKDRVPSGVENIPPPLSVAEDIKGLETVLDIEKDRTAEDIVSRPSENVEEMKLAKDTVAEDVKGLDTAHDMENDRTADDIVSRPAENVVEMKLAKETVQLNLDKDSEELKSRLSIMDSKLKEAELTIMKLNDERRMNMQEKDMLKNELEVLKKRSNVKRAQAGFPLLYVCMVALISVAVGYYMHP